MKIIMRRNSSKAIHSNKHAKPKTQKAKVAREALQYPLIVDTPEGPVLIYWLHRIATEDSEIQFRLVSDRETIVLRCKVGGWVKNKKGDHVQYVENILPEINPPIGFNTQLLRSHVASIDILRYFAGLIVNKSKENCTAIPEGNILLDGDLYVPCFGYYHDNRTAEEADFATRRLEGTNVRMREPNAKEHIAKDIMNEFKITRPQAIATVLAMVNMDATSPESAQPEKIIMKKAKVRSRIVSVFSAQSDDAKNYADFRKKYIKNTGTRKGLYYLKLS